MLDEIFSDAEADDNMLLLQMIRDQLDERHNEVLELHKPSDAINECDAVRECGVEPNRLYVPQCGVADIPIRGEDAILSHESGRLV